jgi:hypothetical protein
VRDGGTEGLTVCIPSVCQRSSSRLCSSLPLACPEEGVRGGSGGVKGDLIPFLDRLVGGHRRLGLPLAEGNIVGWLRRLGFGESESRLVLRLSLPIDFRSQRDLRLGRGCHFLFCLWELLCACRGCSSSSSVSLCGGFVVSPGSSVGRWDKAISLPRGQRGAESQECEKAREEHLQSVASLIHGSVTLVRRAYSLRSVSPGGKGDHPLEEPQVILALLLVRNQEVQLLRCGFGFWNTEPQPRGVSRRERGGGSHLGGSWLL